MSIVKAVARLHRLGVSQAALDSLPKRPTPPPRRKVEIHGVEHELYEVRGTMSATEMIGSIVVFSEGKTYLARPCT